MIDAWICANSLTEVDEEDQKILAKEGHLALSEYVPGKERDEDKFRKSFEDYGVRKVCSDGRGLRGEMKKSE